MSAPPAPTLRVIQSFPDWLPITQTWLHTQVASLPAARIESHIVCERTENLDVFAVPHIHALADRSAAERLWDVGLRALRLRRHLGLAVRVGRQFGARVLHSHFGHFGWADAGAARALGAAHVVTFYGHDVTRLPAVDPRWRRRYAALFAKAPLVLAEGEHMRDRLVDLGCAPERVRVHRLGVPVDAIPYEPRRWRDGEPVRVLVAASFREKKGIPYALEAVARLRRDVPVELTLIGDAGDVPAFLAEKERILETIRRHSLEPVVRMLGYQPHAAMVAEARRHHIFLAPSVTASDGDTEGGSPVAITEMAASGMAIVATRHCDIPRVVRDGVTGLLAEERDVDGLVAHLRRLVGRPDDWRPMLDAGRRHIEAEFDARRQGERLAELYEGEARARG